MDKSPPPPPSPPQTTESSSPTPVTGSPPSAGSLDPLESSSSSPNQNNQLDMQASLRSEEYRQLFRLPPEEVAYMAIVGSFPFNSFLSGVLSCIGTAVLAVCLRIQVNKENKEFKVLLKKVEEKPKPKVASKPILMKILKVISVIRC